MNVAMKMAGCLVEAESMGLATDEDRWLVKAAVRDILDRRAGLYATMIQADAITQDGVDRLAGYNHQLSDVALAIGMDVAQLIEWAS
jgi:hypothetical protein